jgi:nitrile hydratase subunit alpha
VLRFADVVGARTATQADLGQADPSRGQAGGSCRRSASSGIRASAVVLSSVAVKCAETHDHQEAPSDVALRVKSLESLLAEKGLIDPAAIDAIVDTFEDKVGPRNGARVVAHAWVDPAYKQRLLEEGTKSIAELGYSGFAGGHMVVVENTPKLHNLVVCTLCSCYPWPTLGLPPVWYKSAPYRSRSVIDPRGVLRDFGLELPDDVEVRVWDSTAEVRYLVLPERPLGTESLSEDALATLVTRDSMRHSGSGREAMNGVHDMGGMQNMGPVQAEINEPVFHAPWEGHVFAMCLAMLPWGKWTAVFRYQVELIPADQYLQMSYYEKWLVGVVESMVKTGFATRAEIESGMPAPGSPKQIPALTADKVPALINGTPPSRNVAVSAQFQPGERVRARGINPITHTRLPRYARGKVGTIARDYGVSVFPDTSAQFLGEEPQHVYSVRFIARDLWGEQANRRDTVYIDLWDDYLEPA